ncbi:nucleotide exchange factor GrpE [Actinotalea sp.]|uniref:nucleotide exchange factor GrpE n=1 Tax=Actinotalea sp. TaxID=1872145 RepID=UPI0035662195
MTDATTGPGGDEELDPTRPRFTDKRRIDPETGAVRESSGTAPAGAPASADALELETAQAVAAEHLADLQRLQAEYVNYRKRVERDRLVARDQTVVAMIEALLGVLDDVELARQHGELAEGPFAAIAEKLEVALGRFGWERYGAAGEPFDPTVHEALMHAHSDEVSEPTVVQVLQPGHKVGERIVRAARVAVAEPGEG